MQSRPSPFTYTPQRTTQPYRAQPGMGRPPGPALSAMQAGRTLYGFNPQDAQRELQAARPGSLWWHLLNLSPAGPKLPSQ